jgi:hypothetical protein
MTTTEALGGRVYVQRIYVEWTKASRGGDDEAS